MASQRKSQRTRKKSLKAELEASLQTSQCMRQNKKERCASNGIHIEEEEWRAVGKETVTDCMRRDTVSEEVEDSGKDEEVEEKKEKKDENVGRWKYYPSLCSRLPGRERQIQLLLRLMGETEQNVCPSLYVYGNSSTGKTLTLKTIFTTLEVPLAFVNCIECYSSKLLYKTILSQLTGDGLDYIKCDSFVSFLRLLHSHSHTHSLGTIYIVLDKAERLREMEVTLLPALLRLSELAQCPVCTVLVSQLVWEKLAMVTGGVQPISIHFPQYTHSQVLGILSGDCPDEEGLLSFYRTFVNHVWNVLQCVCRDVGELRYLSSLLYPKYCEPVERGEISRKEPRKLWRHIEPYFRGVMSRIYLREVSSVQWLKAQEREEDCCYSSSSSSSSSLAKGDYGSSSVLDLPYYSKYLLIASYLASYNPSKTDKKFFSKQKQSHTRKPKKQVKDKPNYQLLGPKPFPLDRLMAIFYSIQEESLAPSVDIYSQISSLVTLQLIGQLHTKDLLEGPKYKCLVTLDSVRQLARTVGFELVQYLYDFN